MVCPLSAGEFGQGLITFALHLMLFDIHVQPNHIRGIKFEFVPKLLPYQFDPYHFCNW